MDLKVISQNKFLFSCLTLFCLNIYNYGAYALLLYVIVSISQLSTKSFGSPFVFSALLTLSIIPVLNEFYITWGIKMMIASIAGFVIAKKIRSKNLIKTIIIYCAVLFALQLFLSYQYNLSIGNMTSRAFVNVTTMEVSAYTAFAVLLTPTAAVLPFYLCKTSSTPKIELLLIIILAVFSFVANLWLSGRSYWAILSLSLILSFGYSFYNSPNKTGLLNKMVYSIFAILLIFIAYGQEIISSYTNSNFYDRFSSGYEDISKTSRYEIYWYYITHFSDSLFGGGHIREQIHYESHTLWLDVMDMCGLIPFILICFMSVFSYKTIKYYCRRRNHMDFNLKLLVFSFSICCFFQFCIEPVVEGSQWLVVVFWLLITILYYHRKYQSSIIQRT